jgi:hypothetical protein
MADLKYGEVDWNDLGANDFGGTKKTEFMTLTQGDNLVRIMGQPSVFHVNWVDLQNGKRGKVNTPVEDKELVARLEDAGWKTSKRWMLKVLDRSDETFKLLEVSVQIIKGIGDLVNNPKWGKVTNYDINIRKGPKGEQPLYKVYPDPKEALPQELQAAWKKFNQDLNIDRLITPSDPKAVYELLGWTPKTATAAAITDADDSEDGDDDVDFSF